MPTNPNLTPDTPAQLGAWLAALAFVLLLVNAALRLTDRLRGEKPRPPNEELGARVNRLEGDLAAVRQELAQGGARQEARIAASTQAIADRLEQVRQELDAKLGEQMRAAEEGRNRLHERINPVVANTAAIAGQMTAFTLAFEQFTQTVVAWSRQRQP